MIFCLEQSRSLQKVLSLLQFHTQSSQCLAVGLEHTINTQIQHTFLVTSLVSCLAVRMTMATAKCTVVGETLRYVIPTHMHCSIGCRGRACKYEDASRWSEDQQAIRGLYSSWYPKWSMVQFIQLWKRLWRVKQNILKWWIWSYWQLCFDPLEAPPTLFFSRISHFILCN